MADMERVAAIDIGTNTTLLLIAERGPDGTLRAVFEDATITRLGQGVDGTKTLAPEAIARTVFCLEKQAAMIAQHGAKRPDAVRVTGTSAMRDAGGADQIRACVRSQLGVEVEVIAGAEEARLAFCGATSGLSSLLDLSGNPPAPTMVLDVGGGSSELVCGNAQTGRVDQGVSFDVGSVRMTERHVKSDPPSAAELRAIEDDVKKTFTPWTARSEILVGVAGTVTTLASIALELATYDGSRVHGYRMSKTAVEDLLQKLASMPLADRKNVTGLEPKRADVIVAGAMIVNLAMERVEASHLLVSDRGLRWAVCEALARKRA